MHLLHLMLHDAAVPLLQVSSLMLHMLLLHFGCIGDRKSGNHPPSLLVTGSGPVLIRAGWFWRSTGFAAAAS